MVVGLLVFPGTTWHGLPTLDTLRHALDASHLVGEQARLQVAPSPPLKPLMLASILAMWAAIFSCHALAFRAGSPILALLPPIAMLAFADTVLEEFIKPRLRRRVPGGGARDRLRRRAAPGAGVGTRCGRVRVRARACPPRPAGAPGGSRSRPWAPR